MSENTKAADGQHTTNGTPHSFSTVTPFIAVTPAKEAIAFYENVFGARLISLVEAGGRVVHAELNMGNGRLQLGEPNPDFHLAAQPDGDDVSASFGIYVPDADAAVATAEAAGATIREPLATWVSGDRFASIRDPFGVRWTVMTRVEDLSDDESNARVEKWAAEQAQQ